MREDLTCKEKARGKGEDFYGKTCGVKEVRYERNPST